VPTQCPTLLQAFDKGLELAKLRYVEWVKFVIVQLTEAGTVQVRLHQPKARMIAPNDLDRLTDVINMLNLRISVWVGHNLKRLLHHLTDVTFEEISLEQPDKMRQLKQAPVHVVTSEGVYFSVRLPV
jgi:hypothetical protein